MTCCCLTRRAVHEPALPASSHGRAVLRSSLRGRSEVILREKEAMAVDTAFEWMVKGRRLFFLGRHAPLSPTWHLTEPGNPDRLDYCRLVASTVVVVPEASAQVLPASVGGLVARRQGLRLEAKTTDSLRKAIALSPTGLKSLLSSWKVAKRRLPTGNRSTSHVQVWSTSRRNPLSVHRP